MQRISIHIYWDKFTNFSDKDAIIICRDLNSWIGETTDIISDIDGCRVEMALIIM